MRWQADSLPLKHLGSTHCSDYYSFMIQLKSRSVMLPPLLFVFKIAIVTHWLLWICRNFRIAFYISVKKKPLEFWEELQWMCRLLCIYEHFNNVHSYNPWWKISFNLIVPLISFLNILYFSAYRSFTYLSEFIPKYFFFYSVIGGIIFLISLFSSSLYREQVSVQKCN